MIAAQFDYKVPKSLEEAVSLLAADPDGAKVLAGGHSLIPAMKLRLAQPQTLIDIARLKELSYIREQGDQILIGATTTHYEIESSELLQKICPLLSVCAASIGDVQVRNKGTIGGSVAHSDPAGDWPAAVIALGAELVLNGPNGDRAISAEDFFVDLLTTDLRPGEILREIRIKKPVGRFGQAYQKVRHPASGFAVVGVAVSLTFKADGSCETASIGVTGLGAKAYRATNVESALLNSTLDDTAIQNAAAHVCDGIDPNVDLYASGDYRCQLAQVHTRRAVLAAKNAVN
ncbi:MAG TPA: xanthine dehydrogenase family protein subunit M [Pyrinomonadaceae bacterium]|nr:xanthine dehydrogenase family protein subunit M [Pyrinomonadaceae bacterium]